MGDEVNFSINLPSQDEIPAALKSLMGQLKAIGVQKQAILNQIKMVQDICSHPKTTFSNTWGRWPETTCDVCGKNV